MDCLFTSCAADCPDDLLFPLASLSCTTDFSWSFIRKKKLSKYVCEITKRVSPSVENCISIACDIYSERLIENISCKWWPLKWPDSPSWLLHIYLWKLWPGRWQHWPTLLHAICTLVTERYRRFHGQLVDLLGCCRQERSCHVLQFKSTPWVDSLRSVLWWICCLI